jgi:hypothetical protein
MPIHNYGLLYKHVSLGYLSIKYEYVRRILFEYLNCEEVLFEYI